MPRCVRASGEIEAQVSAPFTCTTLNTGLVKPPEFAAKNRITNESPVSIIPIIIFTGVEGSRFRLSSQLQNAASGSESRMMKSGLMALERMPGNLREWSFAHHVSEIEFW